MHNTAAVVPQCYSNTWPNKAKQTNSSTTDRKYFSCTEILTPALNQAAVSNSSNFCLQQTDPRWCWPVCQRTCGSCKAVVFMIGCVVSWWPVCRAQRYIVLCRGGLYVVHSGTLCCVVVACMSCTAVHCVCSDDVCVVSWWPVCRAQRYIVSVQMTFLQIQF